MKMNALYRTTLLAGLVSLSPLNDAHALFGVDEATLEMQIVQQAEQVYHTAELVAQTIEEKLQTIELIQQTVNDRINLVMKPYTQVMGLLNRFDGLMNEAISLQNQFVGLYEDPSTSGNIFQNVQYNQRRLNSSLDRMQRLNQRAERVGTKMKDVNESIVDLSNINSSTSGNLAAQQVGNEAALLNASLMAEQIAGQQEILFALEKRAADEAADRELARARHCVQWKTGVTDLPECKL